MAKALYRLWYRASPCNRLEFKFHFLVTIPDLYFNFHFVLIYGDTKHFFHSRDNQIGIYSVTDFGFGNELPDKSSGLGAG